VRTPYLRWTVKCEPYWEGDPNPWKAYKPHPRYAGVCWGGFPTMTEAFAVAYTHATQDAARLLLQGRPS
jgi:hypothetical protein